MHFFQKQTSLKTRSRGFHLVTDEILQSIPEMKNINVGMLQVFIQHTSASLTINENADPTVRIDFETWMNKAVPEGDPDYLHDYEGDDDMPAHIKSSLMGASVLVPITNGKLNLGTWQGIYLCEHRNYGGKRNVVITAWGSAL
ncbi:secondary thiamine-phosphate synthase enzyme YjbQ [Pedobacter sp.]